MRAHIPALSRLANVELVAIADVDVSKARALARRYQIRKAYEDYADLIRDDLDVVIICAPSPLHATIAVDALAMGKHLLVEKPLAMNVSEAMTIANLAKKKGLKVGVVHNYRYFPAVNTAVTKVRQGRLGRVSSILGVAHTAPPMGWTTSTWLYSSGGAIDDFGPHLFDLVALIADSEPSKITAFGRDMAGCMGCTNQAQILIEFRNGITASCDVSWMVGSRRVISEVYGTGGELLLDVISNFTQEIHGDATPIEDLRLGIGRALSIGKLILSKRLFFGALYYHQMLIRDYIQSIEKNTSPSPGLDDALRVVQICEGARMSIAERRAVDVEELERQNSGTRKAPAD